MHFGGGRLGITLNADEWNDLVRETSKLDNILNYMFLINLSFFLSLLRTTNEYDFKKGFWKNPVQFFNIGNLCMQDLVFVFEINTIVYIYAYVYV